MSFGSNQRQMITERSLGREVRRIMCEGGEKTSPTLPKQLNPKPENQIPTQYVSSSVWPLSHQALDPSLLINTKRSISYNTCVIEAETVISSNQSASQYVAFSLRWHQSGNRSISQQLSHRTLLCQTVYTCKIICIMRLHCLGKVLL